MARTGSGKTACFLIPMLEKLQKHSETMGARGLILSPTRELSLQTLQFSQQLGRFTGIRSCLVVGGDRLEDQFADLAMNPDIIIATPGRLMHHLVEVNDLSLKGIQMVVFDEADRLFEMGFSEQLQEILKRLPESRQTLLFSATLPKMLVDFANAGLVSPRLIRLDTETKLSTELKLNFFSVRTEEKAAALLYLLWNVIDIREQQTIVFVATRHHVEYLHMLLEASQIESMIVFGSMDPSARKINLSSFRNGRAKVLIVTDVAARGIDIPLLDNVVNYDMPCTAKIFVHRSGRVARMGRPGCCYSFVGPDEVPYMLDLFLFLGRELDTELKNGSESTMFGIIPQEEIDIVNDLIHEKHSSHAELSALHRVTLNAYKLYYKTRLKPSPASVARAKQLPPPSIVHPSILHRIQMRNPNTVLPMENSNSQVKLLEGIRNFKPSQTIFEVDAFRKKNTEAAKVMSEKRSLLSKTLLKKNKGPSQETLVPSLESPVMDSGDSVLPCCSVQDTSPPSKRRLLDEGNPLHKQRAEKRLKVLEEQKKFYMNYLPENHQLEQEYRITKNTLNSEEVSFDVVGDDSTSILQRKNTMKWDRKKKKFVRSNDISLGAPDGSHSAKRKLRTESGAAISLQKKALNERGKLYVYPYCFENIPFVSVTNLLATRKL